MRPTFVPLLAGLLLLPAVAAAQGGDDVSPLEQARVEAVRTIIEELEALADWCVENKLLLGRDLCYEVLVRFDPENDRARRTLKYMKRADGTWEQRPYSRPKNKNTDLEPEFYERLDAVKQKLIRRLHQAIKGADEDEKPEVKDRLVETILCADPDDVEAHRLRGETRLDGEWVLFETATAKKHLKELSRAATNAIDEVKAPKEITPTEAERDLGVTWTAAFQGEWWRGMGTVNPHEIERAVRVMDASLPFFNYVFGVHRSQPSGCGFYLLRGQEDATTVLRRHPDFTKDQADYYLTLRAAWIPGRHVFFQWSDNTAVRLDGAVRMAIGLLLLKEFGIDTRRGWVWEGMGLYLDYLLTGSHRTVFVTRRTHTTTKRRTPFDIEARMKEPGANWMLLARQLVDKDLAPDMEIMCAKPVNRLEPEELVYGYALATYLIEGRPEQVTEFLLLHGVMQPIRDTVPAVFEMPLPKFVERFHRWLREVT